VRHVWPDPMCLDKNVGAQAATCNRTRAALNFRRRHFGFAPTGAAH
jgi:hypothetical protein